MSREAVRPDVKPGLYRHYKGKMYQVLEVARHSETLDWYVVYRCLYPNDLAELWIRPASMFVESVTVEGAVQPRFAFISSDTRSTSSTI
ncbi:MAG TPA: DUF1653 domain-containing protein [Pseudobdellovibrionaceae bacterium]|nr:DUF1653 domain-containing protein [Pseudobdellovibrionaceae bacterium]